MGRQFGKKGSHLRKNSRRDERKGKGDPRWPSSLLKELNQGNGKKKPDEEEEEEHVAPGDVYEYEEKLPEEESGKNRRYDSVDQLDYELPSDFEDEEIEEEMAFGDMGTKKSTRRKGIVAAPAGLVSLDSDEGEDEEDEDEDEEEEEESPMQYKPHKGAAKPQPGKSADSFPDFGVPSSDEEEDDDDEEDEEDEEEKHQRMLEAVTGKASEAGREKATKRKVTVVSEVYPESEYNLNPAQGISVEELMTSLQDTAGFGALRKRMQQLQRRGEPVHAPLPKVVQERLERKVGYEKSRDEVTKWQPLVKKNREAPSRVFNKKEEVVTQSTAALAAKFNPTTDMEKEIASLLHQSKLGDVKEVEAAEALELNKLTVEEVRERQQRLAKMRSLLFQHEEKSKRLKKIKSKTFHRLLQKGNRSRSNYDAGDTDAEAVKDAVLKQELKRAQERMTLKHRNTSRWAKRILKRGLKANEDGTRDAIAEQLRTHAMLTKKIQSATLSSSEESSSDEEADEGQGGLAVGGKVRSKLLAKAKVATFQALQGDEEAEIPTSGLFALPFMTRAIEKKRKEAQEEAMGVLEQLEQAEQDDSVLEGTKVGEAVDGQTHGESHSGRLAFGDMTTSTTNKNASGKFHSDNSIEEDSELSEDDDGTGGTGSHEHRDEVEKSNGRFESEKLVTGDESVLIGDEDQQLEKVAISGGQRTEMLGPISVDKAPLNLSQKEARAGSNCSGNYSEAPSTSGNVVVGNNPCLFGNPQDQTERERPSSRPGASGEERQWGRKAEKSMNKQTGVVSKKISVAMAGVSTKLKEHQAIAPGQKGGHEIVVPSTPAAQVQAGSMVREQEAEEGEQEKEQGMRLLDASASQEELIRRAFAGDDVEAEFQEAKAHAVDEEVPRADGTLSLPGWGQWTHIQQKKGPPAWILQEQNNLKRKRDVAVNKRKDAKLKYVMISEKMDKKAAKFMTPIVPFPYKSREVFEKSMRMPIGREYNTDQVFRDMIRPAEIRSAGVIIDPIKYDKSVVKDEGLDVLSHVMRRKRERGSKKAISTPFGKKVRT